MYFASRVQAGRMLAGQLVPKYRYENCAIVALSDGGVMVGAQIAAQLHCVMTMLLISEINLPREPEALAAITQTGTLAYNPKFSDGEVAEMVGEYRGLVEQEKMTQMSAMNKLIGQGGLISRDLLRGHTVILVDDGLPDGFRLDVAAEYLKPIATEKLLVATPLASLKAVDHMHVLADEIYCLSVIEDFMDTDHYYEKHDVPDHETAVQTIQNIILHWQ
jgi:putative phosphoribosyl transferase